MKGLLLDTNYDLLIKQKRDSSGKITGGLVIGDNTDQCAALVLEIDQGDLLEDPLLGVGLTKFIRGKYNKTSLDQRIRSHFTRAGLDYDDYKSRLNFTINNTES